MKAIVRSQLILLASITLLATGETSYANRYTAIDLEATVTAEKIISGNRDKRYIGIGDDGYARVWEIKPDETVASTILDQVFQDDPFRTEIDVRGITNADSATASVTSEMIVGNYTSLLTGKTVGIYWQKKNETDYETFELNPYKRLIGPCPERASPADQRFVEHGSECYDPENPPAREDLPCAEFNTSWKAGELYVIECDDEARTTGINNNKIIIGVSLHTDPDNSELRIQRPVYWIKDAQQAESTNFVAYDLGVPKIGGSIDGIVDEAANTRYRVNYSGEPLLINDQENVVYGLIDSNNDGNNTHHYWRNIEANSHFGPGEFSTDNSLHVSAAFASLLIGWKDLGTETRSFAATLIPSVERDSSALGAEFVVTLGSQFESEFPSKILASDGSRRIGTQNFGTEASPQWRATITDPRCGTEELNQLLSDDLGVIFTEAYDIDGPLSSSHLLAHTGTIPSSYGTTYALIPDTTKYIDLGVTIAAGKSKLTAKRDNVYTIEVTNNANAGNFDHATCVQLSLQDFVYFPKDRARSLKQDPGGITYKSYESADMNCVLLLTSLNCLIPRIDPGETKTLIVNVEPREILIDRTVRTRVELKAREESPLIEDDITKIFNPSINFIYTNNVAEIYTEVDRDACFIATAAYGSLEHHYVEDLRAFRDNILLRFAVGEWLVGRYYAYSPPIADFIRDSEFAKIMVRGILIPVVVAIRHPWLVLLLVPVIIITSSLLKHRKRSVNSRYA